MKLTNKQIAFRMSAFLASGMFLFEVQKTKSINLLELEGTGHLLVLAGLGATGLTLFYLAGDLWAKNTKQAGVVFAFSVMLRIFIAYYIETLEAEQVFESGERWTMHAGNIALAFIEIAFAFTQTKGNETQKAINDIHNDYKNKLDSVNQILEETKKALNDQLELLTDELETANSKVDDLENTLSANEILLKKYNVIKGMINKPQRSGKRWYKKITDTGLIVNCDKDGNTIELQAG